MSTYCGDANNGRETISLHTLTHTASVKALVVVVAVASQSLVNCVFTYINIEIFVLIHCGSAINLCTLLIK